MKKSDWIPVSQLPEEMTDGINKFTISNHVLVSDGKTIWVAFYMFSSKVWQLAHGYFSKDMWDRKPTHWMPLPENP